MNFITAMFGFFRKAYAVAEANGLTQEINEKALDLVKTAATKFATNDQRRSWVISALVAAGVKESVARLAVEIAVQLLKARQA